MNTEEKYLYDNMQKLFYGIEISHTLEHMFMEGDDNKKIDIYFDSLREKAKELIGGSLLSLIEIKQYINERVQNINPK